MKFGDRKKRTVKNGLETIRYCAPQLWSLLPDETSGMKWVKSLLPLDSFKNVIKNWTCNNAPAGSLMLVLKKCAQQSKSPESICSCGHYTTYDFWRLSLLPTHKFSSQWFATAITKKSMNINMDWSWTWILHEHGLLVKHRQQKCLTHQ